MKQMIFAVLGLVILLSFAGCSTMRSGSMKSLENRVQALETRVQTVESELQSAAPAASTVSTSEAEVLTTKKEEVLTAENMTKKQIQQALKNAGYYDGEIDGKIGRKTKAAIMEFQKNMVLKADGVAGKNTKEKLLKYLQG